MADVQTKWDAQTQKALDIEYHRRAAADYDAAVTQYFHFYHVHSLHPWVRQLVRDTPDARVLDIGTGTGVVACTLASLGCRVQAMDHSPEMLETARVRAESMGVSSRVRFEVGDAERLPYPDATFDAVTIQGVLHHMLEITPILREANRVLRPGGQMYISEPCSEGTLASKILNNLSLPLRRVKQLMGRSLNEDASGSEHERRLPASELVGAVESLGLRTQAEYLVHVGLLRFVPERWRIGIVLALSWPTRRRQGDLIFLTARKPEAAR